MGGGLWVIGFGLWASGLHPGSWVMGHGHPGILPLHITVAVNFLPANRP